MSGQGINIRSSSGYVTDGADDTYATHSTPTYPTTSSQGFSIGWESSAMAASLDKNSALDARIAGIAYENVNDATFRIDLSATGSHEIRIAAGDHSVASETLLELYDNVTLITSIDWTENTITTNNFVDATSTQYTAANWPSSNSTITHNFSSTIFRAKVIKDATHSASKLSHIYINALGGSTPISINGTPDTLTLTGSSSAVNLGATINGSVASLTLAGQSSTVNLGSTIDATPAALTISGLSAQVDQGSGINGVIAALALAGQSGQVDLGNSIDGSIASLNLSGITGDVLLGTNILIDGTPASLTLSGIGSQVDLGSGINGTPATLTLSGITGDVIITNDVIINASPANITLNGSTASVTQQVVIDGQIATISLTGNVSEVTQSININGVPGSIALTEITADVVQNMAISGTPGTLTLTGISGSITAGTVVTVLHAESIDMKLFVNPIGMKS